MTHDWLSSKRSIITCSVQNFVVTDSILRHICTNLLCCSTCALTSIMSSLLEALADTHKALPTF